MHEVYEKTNRQIAEEWDRIAPARYRAIIDGKDKTYTEVLCPIYSYHLKNNAYKSVLDVGCGVGYLSRVISRYVEKVTAIDLSAVSIAIAREHFNSDNITYLNQDVNDLHEGLFDFCAANMFLMDCLELERTIVSLSRLIRKGGTLICTIPNPLVMPRYWRYERFSWFQYLKEIPIESHFRTSGTGQLRFSTTHVHRPISVYTDLFIQNKFKLEKFQEVTGSILERGHLRKYPRHIAMRLKVEQ